MSSAEKVLAYINRAVRMTEERGEFVTGDDGYVVFWPEGSPHGALSSADLRILADELDRRNASWDEQVRNDLSRIEAEKVLAEGDERR